MGVAAASRPSAVVVALFMLLALSDEAALPCGVRAGRSTAAVFGVRTTRGKKRD